MSAVRNAFQALPFPLRLRPFRLPPEAVRPAPPLRPLPPPSEGCGCSGEMEGVPRVGSREVSSPTSRRSGGGGGGSSSGRERSRSGGKCGRGRSPSSARSAHSVSASASSSFESLDTEERFSAMPPSPTGHLAVGDGHPRGDRSASGLDRSPQPGPSVLGSG